MERCQRAAVQLVGSAGVEFVFELVLEFVIQVVFEVVLSALWAAFRVAAVAVGRLFGRSWSPGPLNAGPGLVAAVACLLVASGAAVGFGLGWWWGDRQTDQQLGHIPAMLWVSLSLAAGAGLAALPAIRGRISERAATNPVARYLADRRRLWFLVALNVGLAAGVAVGYGTL